MQETGNLFITSVEQHYENHLAAIYSWMAGDFAQKSAEQYELYTQQNIQPCSTGIAVDLGAGHGIHTVALAKLGVTVIAVDFNKQLLEELKENTLGWGVHAIHTDIRNIQNIKVNPEVIVCCDDTIAHLPDEKSLAQFIMDTAQKLMAGGKLILSFRDYSIALNGNDRFIPVKSDQTKILTCILDYEDDRVRVTDLLYINTLGRWEQHLSSYYKLRLNTAVIQKYLSGNRLQIDDMFSNNGMVYIFATRL